MKKLRKIKIQLETVVDGSKAIILAIKIDDNPENELQRFIEKYSKDNKYKKEIDWIKDRIVLMATRRGCDEMWFKDEGQNGESVWALNRTADLRLYCIRHGRLSVIFGGGGIKNTKAYQEDEKLYSIVKILQKVEKLFFQRLEEKEIRYTENGIEGNLTFEIEGELYDDEKR